MLCDLTFSVSGLAFAKETKLLSPFLVKSMMGWLMMDSDCTLDMQTPPEKVFGPAKHT